MEVYLLDSSFNTVGILDECIALEVTKRFFSPGEFRMVLKGGTEIRQAFALYEPVSKGCFIIENVHIAGGRLTLRGRSLEALLEKRILSGRGLYSGGAEDTVRLAVKMNTSGERDLFGMVLGDKTGIIGEGYFRTDFRNLSEFVYETLRPFGAAYKVELSDKTPVFSVVTGKDRRRAQDRYPPAVFSESMGNLSGGGLRIDLSRQKNTAYVLGGDGRSVEVSVSDSPLDRRELFVNAGDISPDEFDTDAEYLDALRSRGAETLSRYGGGALYDCTVMGEAHGTLRYGVDYSLGDVCDVDTESGLSLSERVTAVKYVFDGGSISVTPSFGERDFSIGELIKEGSEAVLK